MRMGGEGGAEKTTYLLERRCGGGRYKDETNPGERGYSMSGGNRFTDVFSRVRGLSAMPSALMFAKPFHQHSCGLTSGTPGFHFSPKCRPQNEVKHATHVEHQVLGAKDVDTTRNNKARTGAGFAGRF